MCVYVCMLLSIIVNVNFCFCLNGMEKNYEKGTNTLIKRGKCRAGFRSASCRHDSSEVGVIMAEMRLKLRTPCKRGAQAGHTLRWPQGRKSTVARFERHTLHSRCRSKFEYILKSSIFDQKN